MLEIQKQFLDYHLKTAESVAMSARTAEKTRSPEALARAVRMAAAAKEQAKAKQAAAARAKAKASEKEEKRLLAEAVQVAAKVAKAAKAAKAAVEQVQAAKSKVMKPEPGPATEQDGEKLKAVKAEAAMATAEATEAEAARLGAEAARPALVQAGRPLSPAGPVLRMQPRTLTLTRCKWS